MTHCTVLVQLLCSVLIALATWGLVRDKVETELHYKECKMEAESDGICERRTSA